VAHTREDEDCCNRKPDCFACNDPSRKKNKMDKSEKFWAKAASTYDQEENKDEQTHNKIIEKTKKYLKMSDVVLDFGCGTGRISNEIAGNVKVVHAIDISSRMIEIAKAKAVGRNIVNIDYAQATIFDERYQRGSFDVLFAFYILHLLEEPQKALQRMYELLKPGGLIISATPCMGEKKFLSTFLSLFSKLGLVPRIRSFMVSDLEAAFANENFLIIENECLHQSSQQYFIVAKKVMK
jgi:2-polyprenyl-3-methyl-5-hydroxy-6-metoxy-1,4-benzoquinol methylase